MNRCSKCNEPAVKTVLTSGASSTPVHFCYLHAVEERVLEAPLDSVRNIAATTGYPVNAILFVAEAIVRAKQVVSARDVCSAVISSARERFGRSSGDVVTQWGILSRTSIGDIFTALSERELVRGVARIPAEDFEESFTLRDVLDAP